MSMPFRLLLVCLLLSSGLLLPLVPAAAQPTAAAPAVRILSAQSGLFGSPGDEAGPFRPASQLPLKDGQTFGWTMTVQTTQKRVRVREEITLPQEPRTWGDPEPDIKRKTSPDGRTATTEIWLEPRDGVIAHTWTVTQGDPKGSWVIKVWVEGQAERVFRFDAR